MTFEKFQVVNNAKGYLDAGLSPTGVSLIMKAEYADLFPTHNGTTDKDYLLTLESLSDDFLVLKREIVRVIARTANVFTIVRSAGYCPASYDAETQTNTAFGFLAGDLVELRITAENDEDIKEEMDLKAYDSAVVHLTGNETIEGIKTLESYPILPSAFPTQPREAATKDYVDVTILSAGEKNILSNRNWILGEDVSSGDNLFDEQNILEGEAIDQHPIGDVAENKRVCIRQLCNGELADDIDFILSKKGTPTVNLNVRIETEVGGEPSGTLVDANATTTIAETSLTTAKQKITSLLADYIQPTKGTAVWLVLYQGTYGSETVDGANFYSVRFAGRKQTSTRPIKTFDGTDYSTSAGGTKSVLNAGLGSVNTSLAWRGIKVQAKRDCILVSFAHAGSAGITQARILDISGNLLKAETYSPLPFFMYKLTSGVTYRMENYVATGSAYVVSFSDTSPDVLVVGGSTNGADSDQRSLTAITTIPLEGSMPFVGGGLFEDVLFSKSDAKYLHKLSFDTKIAGENGVSGQLISIDFDGISKRFTAIEKDAIYYAGNTPGTVSTTPGTYVKVVGNGVDTTEIDISKKRHIIAGNTYSVFALNTVTGAIYNTTYALMKEVTITEDGYYNIYFELERTNSGTSYGQIRRNFVPYGTERTVVGGFTGFTEALFFKKGDKCQLYARHSTGVSAWARVQNFQGKYDFVGMKDNIAGLNPIG